MPDGIIGSVGVSVVPDAADFWRRFQEQTKASAVRAGEQSGRDWRRGFEAANTRAVDVRVNADTARARAQIAALGSHGSGAFQKIVSAAITLAPAIVPLGAAASAAGAELVTMGVVGVLAVKGIKAEMDAGTPTGIEYTGLVHTLNDELSTLEATASSGVLAGFQQSVGKLRSELPAVNELVATQSALLGDTVSHLTGAGAGGLVTFAPLLNEIGESVDRIAAHFEEWATGPGGAKFSETLSKDYAVVAPIIDDIVGAVGHLVAASNGTGLAILSEIGLLARVLDSFPTPVLTGMVDAFVAFRTVRAVQGIISGISGAFPILAANAAASAAAVNASNLAIQASAASTAASVAISQAAEAAAVATSQAEIAAALTASGSILAESAAATAAYAAEEALAFQAAADAAVISAAEIGAAAEAAAAESVAAGEAASIGWTAMLGPLGIVVGAVALFGLGMAGSSQDTQLATQSLQDYTAALRDSNGAITENLNNKVASALVDDKVIDNAKRLGISITELVSAVEHGGPEFDALNKKITELQGHGKIGNFLVGGDLLQALAAEREAFQGATDAINEQDFATSELNSNAALTASAFKNGNSAVVGLKTAIDAFNDSAKTAADRGKLIGEVLRAANGDNLSYAGTMVQVAEANQRLVTDFVNLKDGVLNLKKGTIDYRNAAAAPLISDLGQLQTAAMNAASATYQHELRTKGSKKAAEDAFNVYKNDTRGALIDQAQQLGITSKQAGKLADKYFGLKHSGDIKKQIAMIGQDKVATALNKIIDLLRILDGETTRWQLDQAAANATFAAAGGSRGTRGPKVAAAGGYISGPGTGTSDSIPARLSNGEYVINAAQTSKHLGLLDAINSGAPGFATGGFVGVDYSKGGVDKYGNTKTTADNTVYVVAGQKYSSLQAAENAASRLFHAQVSLGLKIDGSDLTKFRASLKGTADQAHAAFLTMYNDAKKLGISNGLAASLRAENLRLDREISARNRAADHLKAVQAKLTDFRNNVSSAIRGSFDITTAGGGYDGQQPITGANILAQASQAAARARRFVRDVEKLQGKVSKTYLSQLAQKGPDALPEAEALLTLNTAQLKALQADNLSLTASGKGLGSVIGRSLYGADISKYTSQVAMDNRTIDSLATKIGKQVTSAVEHLVDRPIYVQIDGRTVARATASGTAANARRT